jgi:hypothetical protein
MNTSNALKHGLKAMRMYGPCLGEHGCNYECSYGPAQGVHPH